MKCTTRSTCQMKYPDKLSDIPPFQMKCTLRLKFSDEVFRFRYTPHFQMKCSDEVDTETQTRNKEMSSYFQMKCSDKLSDIPPHFRWSAQIKCTLKPKPDMRKWVHIFRWGVQIRCQIYPPQLSIDIWKTITLHNFHDRLIPPPPPIDHRSMADHYTISVSWQTDPPSSNQPEMHGRPLHNISFTYSIMHRYLGRHMECNSVARIYGWLVGECVMV